MQMWGSDVEGGPGEAGGEVRRDGGGFAERVRGTRGRKRRRDGRGKRILGVESYEVKEKNGGGNDEGNRGLKSSSLRGIRRRTVVKNSVILWGCNEGH